MYGFAIDTHIAMAIVAFRNFLFDLRTAGTAVFHSVHRKLDECVIVNVTIRAAGVSFKSQM